MAAEYGFDYEMVTYKWPHWLRGQTEKQREIWGYKILFLDVLFPLSLDKVIFVDADQVVRAAGRGVCGEPHDLHHVVALAPDHRQVCQRRERIDEEDFARRVVDGAVVERAVDRAAVLRVRAAVRLLEVAAERDAIR